MYRNNLKALLFEIGTILFAEKSVIDKQMDQWRRKKITVKTYLRAF
jgi:hypothetical protein